MFHHDSCEFGSWVECTVGITTLYSISMIKTFIIQHFDIFVGSRLKLNLMRKRKLETLSKNTENDSKFTWNSCQIEDKGNSSNSIQIDRKSMISIENKGIST